MNRITPIESLGINTFSTNLTSFNDDIYSLNQKKIGIEKEIDEMEDGSSNLKQRELLELELKLRMVELQIQKLQETAKVAACTQQNQNQMQNQNHNNANSDNSLTVEISNKSLYLCLESLKKENDSFDKDSEQKEPKKDSNNKESKKE